MKKIIVLITITFLIAITNVNAVYSDLSISGPKEVGTGDTIQLKAIYEMGNDIPGIDANGAPDTSSLGKLSEEDLTKKVKWKSSDNSIATINKHGVVTGVKEGVATITAENTKDGREDYYGITVIKSKGCCFNKYITKYNTLILIVLSVIIVVLLILIILQLKKKKPSKNNN